MKTTGRCVVAIENKKGDFYQVALDETGQSFIIGALVQYMNGIKVLNNKLPFTLPKIIKTK